MQQPSERAQRALEAIQEHESLTADLTDRAATALLEWSTVQMQAADAAANDAVFERQATAIRRAMRVAATSASRGVEEESPAAVIARAEAALREQGDPALLAPATAYELDQALPDHAEGAHEQSPEAAVTRKAPPAAAHEQAAAPAPRPSADPAALLRRAPIPPVAHEQRAKTDEQAAESRQLPRVAHTAPNTAHKQSHESHEQLHESHEQSHESHEQPNAAHEQPRDAHAAREQRRESFWNIFRRRWRSRKD